MKVWIDNDGCPRVVRDLVLTSAARRSLSVTVVGNSWAKLPDNPLFSMTCVPGGFDAADDHIAEHAAAGDLVITSDVPLAGRIVAKGATGINAQGKVFSAASIGDQLATRNLMQELRGGGIISGGGPPPFGPKEKQQFANALEKSLDKLRNGSR